MDMDCPMYSGPVTLEIGPENPISTSLTDALLAAGEADRIGITRDCWDCGWHEERQLRVESIETTKGDEPLDLDAPDNIDVYDGDATTVDTTDDDR
nr:hypothetical protein [Natrinema sp. CBA1119]